MTSKYTFSVSTCYGLQVISSLIRNLDLYIRALVCRASYSLRYSYILCLYFLREVGQHHLHIHLVCFRIPSLLFAPLSQPNESDPVYVVAASSSLTSEAIIWFLKNHYHHKQSLSPTHLLLEVRRGTRLHHQQQHPPSSLFPPSSSTSSSIGPMPPYGRQT